MCSTKSFRDGKGEVVAPVEKPKTAEELYLEVKLKQQLIRNMVKNRMQEIVDEPNTIEELRKFAIARGIIKTSTEVDKP